MDENMNIHRHVKIGEIKERFNDRKPFYIDIVAPKKDTIDSLRNIFRFHPTNLEDCTEFSENPKLEEHKGYTFTVMHSVVYDQKTDIYESFDIHIFLGENFIVTVHDQELNVLHEVLERLVNGNENKELACEHVYYTILDTIVDSYFPVLNYWSTKIDEVEEYVFEAKPGEEVINRIIAIRKGLLALKRIIMPQREIMYRISHTNVNFISEETRMYLRDVFDHTAKSYDMVEEQRDMLSNIMDAHFSRTSAEMNGVMKKLTILSTIFMPLTFIVGIYGMNFKHIPELAWHYGYYFIMFVMAAAAAGFVWYFKKKKWF